ncbi:MAG: undecaprenyl/decaprenyl-phosphate alpha-N-acetylglucosaminyl 1-phosphate transferase [Candidatus Aminicenantes bacterium]|nr:undecaprenyl/decaprenyl-phosphate alpha-N-acetylglucosaminyl 1-phosphate transferase [Candidatus Aminicenantes bacterium]
MNTVVQILAFCLALFLSLYGTPIARRVAYRYGILDIPDGRLKTHHAPIPYLGGVMVFFAMILPLSLLFDFSRELLGLLFAATILLMVGLFDDLKALSPGIKFFFQIVAAVILLKSGIRLQLSFIQPWLNYLLSFLWILSLINAYNIIDIMDGLATSCALPATLMIFTLAELNGNHMIAIIAVSLAGSLIGFLYFNWSPASIYLGDSGSMVIGMMIGSLVIMIDHTRHNDLGFLSALFVVAVPVFDLVYVFIQRLAKRRSPFLGSPDHLALRLRKKLCLSSSQTTFFLAILQSALWIPVMLNYFGDIWTAVITTITMVLFFAFLGLWLADEPMP